MLRRHPLGQAVEDAWISVVLYVTLVIKPGAIRLLRDASDEVGDALGD